MAKQENNSSGIPLIIIGAVLITALVGGWYLLQTSKSTPPKPAVPAAGNTPKSTPTPINVNAPAGATPPNILGSPTSLVTIEEFADFQCSACASAHPTMKEIQSIYGSRIKFVFRNFPLQMHEKAYDAAVAAEAAGMQGKFWDMQNQLLTNQAAWSADPNYRQLWAEYAQKIGLNVGKWQTDMAGLGAKSRVDLDLARGRALNVNSTPTVFINGSSIPFPDVNVTSLRQIIDAELQKTAAQNQPTAGGNASSPATNNSNTSPK